MAFASQLTNYCQRTYGKSFSALNRDELAQMQDHLGPFVNGGPQKLPSLFAKWAVEVCDNRLRELKT